MINCTKKISDTIKPKSFIAYNNLKKKLRKINVIEKLNYRSWMSEKKNWETSCLCHRYVSFNCIIIIINGSESSGCNNQYWSKTLLFWFKMLHATFILRNIRWEWIYFTNFRLSFIYFGFDFCISFKSLSFNTFMFLPFFFFLFEQGCLLNCVEWINEWM